MDSNELTNDLRAKLHTCKSEDELKALAEEQGNELTDERLLAVSGGQNQSCPSFEFFCRTKAPCLDNA